MIHTIEPQLGVGSGPIRPSRHWYLVAGCLLAAAVACLSLAVTGIFSWDRQIQRFQRVPVPGQGEVTLTQPGEYVLYVETRGQCCSWAFGIPAGPLAAWSMQLGMGPAYGGADTPVSDWRGMPESYGVTGHQGLTGMTFTITHPGTYLINTSDVHPAAVTDLAVGRSITRATLLPLILLLTGLVTLLGAVVSFVFTAVRRRQARRRQGQPPEMAEPGPWSQAGSAPGASAPVLVEFAGPARQRRGTVLFRAVLAVPALFCLHFARYAAWLILFVGWFGALFTGRLPDSAGSFLAGFQRWEVRTYAYLLLLTDRYPPFGLLDADYPVSVTIVPGRLNRAAVLFRLVLIFPAWFLATLLWYGLGPLLMIPVWLIVLIRGRMPQSLYEAIAASLRFWARTKAYWYLLTDVYPADLFGDEPGPAASGAAPGFGGAGPISGGWESLALDDPVPLPADYVGQPSAFTAPPESAGAIPWAPVAAVPGAPAGAGADGPAGAGGSAGAGGPAGVGRGAPGRLVLSRRGKWLVGLTLSIGAAMPVALFALLFVAAAPPGPAVDSLAAAPASTAPARSASVPSASPAPAPSAAAPAPPLSTAEWLNGLTSLRTRMDDALTASPSEVTSVSLGATARQLSRCSPELAALGPPTAQLRQVHRLAARACQSYKRGTRCYVAAAGLIGPDGSAGDPRKVNKLLRCGDARVNRASDLLGKAVLEGSFVGSAG
jgi:Domain of unknown function (DUF4389)